MSRIRSIDRILKIGDMRLRCYAEDWADQSEAETAASLCAIVVNHPATLAETFPHLDATDLPVLERLLGLYIRFKLAVDDSRPYAFSIIVEPIADMVQT